MKKCIAFLFTLASGLYLLTLGIMPDFIPLIDEGIALLIFVQSSSYLGWDMKRFLGFRKRRGNTVSQSGGD